MKSTVNGRYMDQSSSAQLVQYKQAFRATQSIGSRTVIYSDQQLELDANKSNSTCVIRQTMAKVIFVEKKFAITPRQISMPPAPPA